MQRKFSLMFDFEDAVVVIHSLNYEFVKLNINKN